MKKTKKRMERERDGARESRGKKIFWIFFSMQFSGKYEFNSVWVHFLSLELFIFIHRAPATILLASCPRSICTRLLLLHGHRGTGRDTVYSTTYYDYVLRYVLTTFTTTIHHLHLHARLILIVCLRTPYCVSQFFFLFFLSHISATYLL